VSAPIENLGSLEQRLGHTFTDRALLERALSHRSFPFEKCGAATTADHNEQLEHLGDAILGFLVSEYLYHRFPDFSEGQLTQLKSQLVNRDSLHEAAKRIGLGAFLILGKTEEVSGGRKKGALLANAIEALIAALYLDGGVDAARAFVLDVVLAGIELEPPVPEAKTALQEWARENKLPAPRYVVVEESGPPHLKLFTIEARVGDQWREQATGTTKKGASQKAAELLLARILPR
jgi:ribonuclease-3